MNRIKDIRENYDLITEREEADVKKLTSLVRAGLFDAKKLPMLKRALEKNPDEMTVAERKVLLSLLDTLMSEVLHSQQVYSNVKRNVSHKDNVNEEQEELDEATKDYLSKFDPRFGTKQPSEQDLPTVLVLKRKGIRVYPDNQKVGLYYSQAIDRYISIPFGNVTFGINEDTITLNEKEKKSSNNASNSAEYYRRQLEKQRRKALSKVAEYSEKSAADLTKKQQNTAIKHAYKSAASQGDLEQLVNVGAYHLGAGIRRLLGGKHKAETQPGNEQSSTPEVKAIKPPEAVKPPEAKVVSAPEKVIPTKKFRKRKNPVAGAGEQPTGDFKFAEPFAKTKTASYSSAVAPARELSPLEKSSGNIDPKKQLPRKRYGFDPKVNTGPQPSVGKTKLKAAFQRKLSESREQSTLDNALPYAQLAAPLIPGRRAGGAVKGLSAAERVLDAGSRAYNGDYKGAVLSGVQAASNFMGIAGLPVGGLASAIQHTHDKKLNHGDDVLGREREAQAKVPNKIVSAKNIARAIGGGNTSIDPDANKPLADINKEKEKERKELAGTNIDEQALPKSLPKSQPGNLTKGKSNPKNILQKFKDTRQLLNPAPPTDVNPPSTGGLKFSNQKKPVDTDDIAKKLQRNMEEPNVIAFDTKAATGKIKAQVEKGDTSLWGDDIVAAKPAPVKAPPDVSPPPVVPAPRRTPERPLFRPKDRPSRVPLKPFGPTPKRSTPPSEPGTPGTTPGQPEKLPGTTPPNRELPKVEPPKPPEVKPPVKVEPAKVEPAKVSPPATRPDIDIPDTKPGIGTPGQPQPSSPAAPATAPATAPVIAPAALPVSAPAAQPAAVKATTALPAAAEVAPALKTGANVRNRNAQRNAGENKGGKGKNFRIPGLPNFVAPSDSPPKKFSQPLGFNLQAKTTKAGEFDPYDVRRERERQIYAKSLKEDEDTDRRTVSYKKISTPLQFKSDKLVKTTGPKQRTIRDVRSERERQIYNTQSSSDVVSELRNIKENNLKENYINISGNQILINNMVANKILQVYESLADSNKTKMNEMLNETTDSFKKILNFAVRQ